MPAMIVWPVSASVRTRNVGSSSASFCSAMPSLSWSAFVFGSMATSMTGFGNFIASRMTGWSSSHSVSPVRVSLRPIAAAMSPAQHFLDLVALVRVHLQQPADPLPLVLGRVVDVAARLERARVDPEEGQPADVRVGRDLERQRRERRVVVRLADLERLVVLRQVPLHRRDVDRARQVVDDRIEQRLHALVLEGGAAEHRHDLAGRRSPCGWPAGSPRATAPRRPGTSPSARHRARPRPR